MCEKCSHACPYRHKRCVEKTTPKKQAPKILKLAFTVVFTIPMVLWTVLKVVREIKKRMIFINIVATANYRLERALKSK